MNSNESPLHPDPRGSPCIICGGSSTYYFTKHSHGSDWRLNTCDHCGFGFVSNRPTLERLREVYGGEITLPLDDMVKASMEKHVDARQVAKTLCSLTAARGTSLDVGSGAGAFSYHLQKQGFRPLLIDLDARSEDACRYIPNSSFRVCAFEDVREVSSFDAIVMSQTLEHSLDPIGWLKHAHELLSPQGVIAVAVPNFGGVYRLLGTRDPFIIPPLHLNFFTPRSLRIAFEKAGLKVAKIRSANHVGISEQASVKTRFIRSAWNILSRPLDHTTRGIIVQAFGKKA